MTKYFFSFLLFSTLYFGAAMFAAAAQAHPSGPENRPFAERTIRLQGKAEDFFLTFAYPKPDDIVDWTSRGGYDVSESFSTPLMITFDYKGYFWQGVFGKVAFDVKINKRKPHVAPWKDLDTLLQGIQNQRFLHSEVTKNDTSETRQKWLEPFPSRLNGIPCIQQYVAIGDDQKGELHYYFPFEEDHAVEIIIGMVNNSTRPGLPDSDWRPRAETFANKLLSTVKVQVEPRK